MANQNQLFGTTKSEGGCQCFVLPKLICVGEAAGTVGGLLFPGRRGQANDHAPALLTIGGLMHALCRCKPQQLIPDALFALYLAALSSACAVLTSLELTMVSHSTEPLGKRGTDDRSSSSSQWFHTSSSPSGCPSTLIQGAM